MERWLVKVFKIISKRKYSPLNLLYTLRSFPRYLFFSPSPCRKISPIKRAWSAKYDPTPSSLKCLCTSKIVGKRKGKPIFVTRFAQIFKINCKRRVCVFLSVFIVFNI